MAKRIAKIPALVRSIKAGSSPMIIMSIFLLVSLFAVQSALAGGFALSGVGSKAINLGGAFRGLADDWSAAYWNPAGLTQMQKSEFTAMLVGISPRVEYTPNITYGGFAVGYRNGQVRYPNDKTTFIPDVAGFLKFENLTGVTAGVAIFVPNGLASEWDLYSPLPEMNIRHAYPWYDHKADLTVIDIHPTVAKSFMDNKLSIGVGISMQRGSITFKKTYLKPSGFPLPHENLLIDTELNGDGWGYGANAGILYKFNDKLQFGISGKTGTTLKMSGTADQELYTMNNEDLKNILLESAAGSGASPAEIGLIRLLFGTDNLVSSPSAKADVKTPADFGFGLAYKPTDKLTFTGDVVYTQWSSLDSILI